LHKGYLPWGGTRNVADQFDAANIRGLESADDQSHVMRIGI